MTTKKDTKKHLKFPLLVVSRYDGADSIDIVNTQDELVEYLRDTFDASPEDSMDEVYLCEVRVATDGIKMGPPIYGTSVEVQSSYSFTLK
jgi:hypothetical protein